MDETAPDRAVTNDFMQLTPDEQWERIHHRVLFEGATEQEHWMHREIERLRERLRKVLRSRSGDIHVMPDFGNYSRPHEDSAGCWCEPQADPLTLDRTKYANTVWIHEVQS